MWFLALCVLGTLFWRAREKLVKQHLGLNCDIDLVCPEYTHLGRNGAQNKLLPFLYQMIWTYLTKLFTISDFEKYQTNER